MRNAARLLIGVVGASDVAAGIALLVQPVWFFEQVGHFAPYNQHYEGDTGAFVVAIGVALLLAAARPVPALLGVGLLASLLHLANHVYATTREGAPWSGAVGVALQLGLLVLGLVLLRLDTPPTKPGGGAETTARG